MSWLWWTELRYGLRRTAFESTSVNTLMRKLSKCDILTFSPPRRFRIVISPLRWQFVQPAHFEHLVSGGSVEARVGRNIGHGVSGPVPQRVCRLRVQFALHDFQRAILWARGSSSNSQALRGQQVPLVQTSSGQNAGALIHRRVFVFVRVGSRRSRRGHFLSSFLWFSLVQPHLFSVETWLNN